ncbi:histone chaperone ASF1 [Nematocida displodere]|uniref:Anti-silencing function protein 1 n=1 Tax=Nematocida displodere TaxID=1805483 RepID=A0A177EI82_9MICR|nr:histone chaperone ASF1 [Nematocida displodere]
MIEVSNIDFLRGRTAKDLLQKPMTPVVKVISTANDQSLRVKIVYIATSDTDDYDQVLCDEVVDEIPEGVVEFDLTCALPNLAQIPKKYLLGVTSVVAVFYTPEGKEFARIGYFVNVEYPGVYIREVEAASPTFPEQDLEESSDLENPEGLKNPENPEGLEEQEEAEEGEGEPTAPEGTCFLSPEEFSAMEIDYAKVEAEVLEPPLVTFFSEAWEPELKEDDPAFALVGEEPEELS